MGSIAPDAIHIKKAGPGKRREKHLFDPSSEVYYRELPWFDQHYAGMESVKKIPALLADYSLSGSTDLIPALFINQWKNTINAKLKEQKEIETPAYLNTEVVSILVIFITLLTLSYDSYRIYILNNSAVMAGKNLPFFLQTLQEQGPSSQLKKSGQMLKTSSLQLTTG